MSATVRQIRNAFSEMKIDSLFDDIRINMKFGSKKILYQRGYKFCNSCSYVVKTDIIFCPVCNRKYRTTVINNKSRRGDKMFSEPVISLGVIKLDSIGKRVDVK